MGESDHRAAEWIVKEDGNKWDTTITDLVELNTQMQSSPQNPDV